MSPRQQVSRAAIDLVKRFEGYRREAARLPDGRWTIGYGHTVSAREGAQVGETDAEALLLFDLMQAADAVRERVFAPLTQNQFDALCAFAFSIGADEFRASEVLKRVNAGEMIRAAFEIELWRRADFEGESLVIDALVRRRAAEKLLFLTPPGDAWPAAPSLVLKARLDRDGRDLAPAREPTPLVAALHGEAAAVTRVEPAAAEQPESPVTAAAAAVAGRLDALFPEAPVETTEPSPADVAPEVEPEPEPEPEREAQPEPEAAAELELGPEAIVSEAAAEPPATAAAEPVGEAMPRILIDDSAPYEFIPAPVQPIAPEPDGGPLVIAALIVLGLAFFGGGVFWALNAQAGATGAVFSPLVVGWLAGVAGVGFVASAVFMMLQRLGRTADIRDRSR